jgi:hypothetical protein
MDLQLAAKVVSEHEYIPRANPCIGMNHCHCESQFFSF